MGGTRWKPWFVRVCSRKAGGVGKDNTSADDPRALEALESKYQAAVKENDAATMETILADDFGLVTGSGKVYTKADLDGAILRTPRDKIGSLGNRNPR